MYVRRQFFSLAYHPYHKHVYAIGGYNNRDGALDHVERYCLDKKEWEQVTNLNSRRINCGSCIIGPNHVFVFGGRNENTFYDSVERFNIELNLWNLLKI